MSPAQAVPGAPERGGPCLPARRMAALVARFHEAGTAGVASGVSPGQPTALGLTRIGTGLRSAPRLGGVSVDSAPLRVARWRPALAATAWSVESVLVGTPSLARCFLGGETPDPRVRVSCARTDRRTLLDAFPEARGSRERTSSPAKVKTARVPTCTPARSGPMFLHVGVAVRAPGHRGGRASSRTGPRAKAGPPVESCLRGQAPCRASGGRPGRDDGGRTFPEATSDPGLTASPSGSPSREAAKSPRCSQGAGTPRQARPPLPGDGGGGAQCQLTLSL